MVGAIGQPDVEKGELPCAYVQLNEGENTTNEEIVTDMKDISKLCIDVYQNIKSNMKKL